MSLPPGDQWRRRRRRRPREGCHHWPAIGIEPIVFQAFADIIAAQRSRTARGEAAATDDDDDSDPDTADQGGSATNN